MRVINATRRLAIDTVSYFTPYEKGLGALGPYTVFRYLNYGKYYRDTPDTSDDWFKSCSKQELEELIGRKWNVGFVQRGIGRRNQGGADAGKIVGEAAVYNAIGIGIPAKATIVCDCEWSNPPPKDKQIAYIEEWGKQLHAANYTPCLYVSPDLALTSKELYALRYIKAYWKSASAVPTVDTRGYQVMQSLEYFYNADTGQIQRWSNSCYRHNGIRMDMDMVGIDGKGDYFKAVTA